MNKMVLCAASSYNQKYYFNPQFDKLPDVVKDELKILAVTTADKLGGILTIGFYEDSALYFESSAEEQDYLYDEIGVPLEIDRIKREKQEWIHTLQLFYTSFFLNPEGETL